MLRRIFFSYSFWTGKRKNIYLWYLLYFLYHIVGLKLKSLNKWVTEAPEIQTYTLAIYIGPLWSRANQTSLTCLFIMLICQSLRCRFKSWGLWSPMWFYLFRLFNFIFSYRPRHTLFHFLFIVFRPIMLKSDFQTHLKQQAHVFYKQASLFSLHNEQK